MSVNRQHTPHNSMQSTASANCAFCGCCMQNEPNYSTLGQNASNLSSLNDKPYYSHEMTAPQWENTHTISNTVSSYTSHNVTMQPDNWFDENPSHMYSFAPETKVENSSYNNITASQANASTHMPVQQYCYSYESNANYLSDYANCANANSNSFITTIANNTESAMERENYEIHDNYLKAPITVTMRNVYPTIGSERLFSTSTAITPSFATNQNSHMNVRENLFACTSRNDIQVCNAFHNGRCLLSERCPDVHVNREYLEQTRRELSTWVAQSENNFYYTLTENPQKTFRVFVVELKEVIDVPIAYISFTRGLYVDPLTRSRRIRASGHGTCNHVGANSGQAPTNCGLYSLDPHQCKWRRWCNQVHIDPAWLRAKKRDFEDWFSALSVKFANMKSDNVVMVHDPQLKVVLPIPKYAITMLTRGVFQGSSHKAPSVCLLFQRNRCTANGCCNQVHIDCRYLQLARQLYLLDTNANTSDTHARFTLKNEIERLRNELTSQMGNKMYDNAANEYHLQHSTADENSEYHNSEGYFSNKHELTTIGHNNSNYTTNNNTITNNKERDVNYEKLEEHSSATKVKTQSSKEEEEEQQEEEEEKLMCHHDHSDDKHNDDAKCENEQTEKNRLLDTASARTFLLDMQQPCQLSTTSHSLNSMQATQRYSVQQEQKVTTSFPTFMHNIPSRTNRGKHTDLTSFNDNSMQSNISFDSGAVEYNNYVNSDSHDYNSINTTSSERYNCTGEVINANDVAKACLGTNDIYTNYNINDHFNKRGSKQNTEDNSINIMTTDNRVNNEYGKSNNDRDYRYDDNGNDTYNDDDVCTANNSITNSINSMRHVNPDGTYSNNPYGSKGSLLYPHASYEQSTIPLHLLSQHTPSIHANSLCSMSSHRAGPVRTLLAPITESAPNIFASEQLESQQEREEEFYSERLPLNTFELSSESQHGHKNAYNTTEASDKLSSDTPINVTVSTHSHRGSSTPLALLHNERVKTTRAKRMSFSSFRDDHSHTNINVGSFSSTGTSYPQANASLSLGRIQTPLLHSQEQSHYANSMQ